MIQNSADEQIKVVQNKDPLQSSNIPEQASMNMEQKNKNEPEQKNKNINQLPKESDELICGWQIIKQNQQTNVINQVSSQHKNEQVVLINQIIIQKQPQVLLLQIPQKSNNKQNDDCNNIQNNNQVKQIDQHCSEKKEEIQKISNFGNEQQNPEEAMKQLLSVKPNCSSNQEGKIKNCIKNGWRVRNLSKIIKNNVQTRTQNNSDEQFDKQTDNKSMIPLKNSNIHSRKISVISNVINYYCKLQKPNQLQNELIKKPQNKQKIVAKQKNIKKSKYSNGNFQFFTQPKPLIINNKIKKNGKCQKEEDQVRKKLKVVFQRKKKLQQKLKKLNQQLKVLNDQQQNKATVNLRYKLANQKSMSPSQRIKSNVHPRYSPCGSSKSVHYNQQNNQLQMSRKAIQFIKRVNRQSIERKISLKNKINRIAEQKAKKNGDLGESREKCKSEVVEDES